MKLIDDRTKNWLENYSQRLAKTVKDYQKKEVAWKYIEVALTLFTIAFFVVFAIRPALSTISGLVGEIKEKEATSREMQRKINTIIEAQENYARYQEKVALIDSFLPPTLSLAQGLAQVIGSAGEAQVPLEIISVPELSLMGRGRRSNTSAKPKPNQSKSAQNKNKASKHKVVQPSALASVEFSLSAKSDYFRLRELLNRLKQTRRWIEITQYRMDVPDKEKDQSGLKLIINGRVYFWQVSQPYSSTKKKL